MRTKLTYRQLYNTAVKLKEEGVETIDINSRNHWLAVQTASQLTGEHHYMTTWRNFGIISKYKEVPKGYAEFCEKYYHNNTVGFGKNGTLAPIDVLIDFCKKQITSRGGKV